MNEDTIVKLLTNVVDKLGTNANTVFHAYVAQARIDAWVDGAIGVAAAAVASIGLWTCCKWWKEVDALKVEYWYKREDLRQKAILVGGFSALTFLTLVPWYVASCITEALNPTYFAINKLLGH